MSAEEINGGNTSFRRQAVLDAGLFDEDMGGSSWGEDIDLSVRVRKCGYELLVDTRLILIHLEAPVGGCGNRNPHLGSALQRERLELRTYVCLKNLSAYGLSSAWSAFWQGYRAVALNKTTIRGGLGTLWEGHMDWLALLARISKRLLHLYGRGVVVSP